MSLQMAKSDTKSDSIRHDIDRPAIIAKGAFGGGMAALLLVGVIVQLGHGGMLNLEAEVIVALLGAVAGTLLALKR